MSLLSGTAYCNRTRKGCQTLCTGNGFPRTYCGARNRYICRRLLLGFASVFQHANGVLNFVSGYSGGDKSTVNHDTVSGGRAGHAVAVQVTYDPKVVCYGKLLRIYFSAAHGPTTLNR